MFLGSLIADEQHVTLIWSIFAASPPMWRGPYRVPKIYYTIDLWSSQKCPKMLVPSCDIHPFP